MKATFIFIDTYQIKCIISQRKMWSCQLNSKAYKAIWKKAQWHNKDVTQNRNMMRNTSLIWGIPKRVQLGLFIPTQLNKTEEDQLLCTKNEAKMFKFILKNKR
ncbi:hypothetical protein Y1Q_0000558 [Alligator mississippiensis]|uniref:Uncharacterized protein n=1 Tax=Alligator mississippiensis TaxID=8496 RepID=A0A151MBI7_ALLMI|nr:hypothetical protein Y1Q_0000558 [Alligator mississippiensis]